MGGDQPLLGLSIVFASHTHLGSPFVVGSHHLARAFQHLGARVLHLSTPVSIAHVARVADEATRERLRLATLGRPSRYLRSAESHIDQNGASIINLVPFTLVPAGLQRRLVERPNLVLACTWPRLRASLRRWGFDRPDILMIDEPVFAGVWHACEPRAIVYRPTDVYPDLTPGSAVKRLEARITARSSLVVCTSETVAKHVRHLPVPTPSLIVQPNGVDLQRFSAQAPEPAEYADISSPRAVYVGHLDSRIDLSSLAHAAHATPDVNWVLIGPTGGIPDELLQRPNVHALGLRPHASIPGYLQHAMVGLLPFSDDPANVGRSPMKLYEYLASGIPVALRSVSGAESRTWPAGVHRYSGGEHLAATVRAVLDDPPDREALRKSAAEMDWRSIALKLVTASGGLPPG